MSKEYRIYVTKNREARESFFSGEYVKAINLYDEAIKALTIHIEKIAGKDKARYLHDMNEACNVRENIVRCYRQLSLTRRELSPGIFLPYGDCILAYINSVRKFSSSLELMQRESLSPKSATEIARDTADRKSFLERGEIAEWFSEFVRCNMHDVVTVKRQTIEDLQAYVSEIVPSMERAKEKFDEIVNELRPMPVVFPVRTPFVSPKQTTELAKVFTREESLVYEDIADQLIDFYNGNKQSLGQQFKKTLLKTAYECYKKYKDYINSIKDSYEDGSVYVRDILEIIGSLSTTVDQFVQFNGDFIENERMLIEMERWLDAFITSEYVKLSIEQKLSFHNYQCCIRCRALSIRRQRADYDPTNRISLIFTNIFNFSSKIPGRDRQFNVETTEIMGCYDGIVHDFLLARISEGSCDQPVVTGIIDHIVEYSQTKRVALKFQEEDLLALGRNGACAKWLMQSNSPYPQKPHEALVGFVKQLLSQKKSAALVAISDIFVDVSCFLASIEGYEEIAKIFVDFVTYFPKQKIDASQIAPPPMAAASVFPVALAYGRVEALTFIQAIPEVAAMTPLRESSEKRRGSHSQDGMQVAAGGFFPMFTVRATHEGENRKLPPKKRLCRLMEEEHHTTQQQPIGVVAAAISTDISMVVDEPVVISRMIGTPPV